MKRVFQIVLMVFLSCLCILGVAALGTFLHVLYGDAPSKVTQLEKRVQALESLPVWRPGSYRCHISTTDRPESTNWWENCRLAYGTNGIQTFDIYLGKQPGKIRNAWISDWTPRSEMAKFDELSVTAVRDQDGCFRISAKAHTNESVSMDFTVTFVLHEAGGY